MRAILATLALALPAAAQDTHTWGRGLTPDRVSVVVPPGYIADPPEIDVPEDEMGRIVIREYLGF